MVTKTDVVWVLKAIGQSLMDQAEGTRDGQPMPEGRTTYKIWHASGNTPLKSDPSKFAHHFSAIILIADKESMIRRFEEKLDEFVEEIGAKTRLSDYRNKELKRPW